MNSRAKKRLTRSWQDRDWNRNRRCWHRLPVPLGQSCWVLVVDEESTWQPVEKKLAGMVDIHAFGTGMTYAVQDVDDLSLTDLVLPHDLFESFEQAEQETERRNRQQ
ncbi:hypothetical protein ACS3UN_06965 [Oscillospiraceae bacterium LTW-04]|nr:hypothetical protein RBH76_03395 [Oscillospiraceae bacterium MB24-C1]